MRSTVMRLAESAKYLRRRLSNETPIEFQNPGGPQAPGLSRAPNDIDFSPPNQAPEPGQGKGPEQEQQKVQDQTRRSKAKLRVKLALTILSLYLSLLTSAEWVFLGKNFVLHFIWITLAYGGFLCPLNVLIAKKTQRHFYKRIHRIVYATDELTLVPGELPAVRRAVVALPWYAAARDLMGWIVTNFIYCFCLLRPWVMITHDSAFPSDSFFWLKAFVLLTFPFAPLVMMAALLAFSAATSSYVQFFFRQGEYEQHRFAITPDKRRYTYVGLIGYTLLLVIAVLNCNLTSANFKTISEALGYAKETEVVGLYLIVIVWSLLVLLGRQEARSQRRLPAALAARAHSITPMDKRCPKCQLVVGFGIDICPQDGTPLAFSGDEASFGTNYEFLEEIARGGMCVIYKARHRLLKKVVAIKMLDTHYSQAQAAERFAHEARAVSCLDHPNIVSVLDFGTFQSHKLFLVMEYLPGSSLANLIVDSGNGLPVKECLRIFDSICDAMSYAHEHKILHRDLKPSNIMVDASALQVKVVDFGIAKILEGTARNLTKTGDIFGTPDYMSPEQCLGEPLGIPSDIYSMGCLMYETLTGCRPSASENPMATMYRQINEQPESVNVHRPDLGALPELESVVMTALAKLQGDRQESFGELRAQIQMIQERYSSLR
jgi:tRNA A-37 threonylcarbamoyl transferase component Bud32